MLIPTINEPVEVLRKTLLACNDLKYPHRTLVLDDGASFAIRWPKKSMTRIRAKRLAPAENQGTVSTPI